MNCIDSHVFIIPEGQYDNISYSLEEIKFKYKYIPIVLMQGIITETDSILSNRNFLDSIKGINNFYPFVFLHPLEKKHFKKLFYDYKIYGIKLHPSISQVRVNSMQFKPILEFADKQNLPVLIHCGRNIKSRFRYIINILGKYNNPFIVAHLGGIATELIMKTLKQVKEENLLERFPNLYFNTSSIYNPKLLSHAIDILGHDRVIFGSDEPFHDFEAQMMILKKVLDDEESKEKIFYSNMKKLLDGVII